MPVATMEEQGEDSLDGSSIKPVSSLRSHFEQMGKSTTTPAVPPPRPISPNPTKHDLNNTKTNRLSVTLGQMSLRQPKSGSMVNATSPSEFRQRGLHTEPTPLTIPPPAVTVQPPTSPPKIINLESNLTEHSLLKADTSRSTASTTGMSSPRHFRIPSRPNTPFSDVRQTPSVTHAQPPEPPPPRRSGELRREPTKLSMGSPPPINRAEKPTTSIKQAHLPSTLANNPSLTPKPSAQVNFDRTSPFSTPPSGGSSPENDTITPQTTRSRLANRETMQRSQTPKISFEPPPIHHSVVNRRKDRDSEAQNRFSMLPQVVGNVVEQRPALPARPSVNSSSASRISMDIPTTKKVLGTSAEVLSLSQEAAANESPLPVLPKRNFSTPTSQVQTPPRTHGRSMTVDQASERAPQEFRIAKVTAKSAQISPTPAPSLIQTTLPETTAPSQVEFPDPSHSNRRPPLLKVAPPEIATKSDARIFDVCGEYVCTSGYTTRIWSLLDGEQVLNIPHSDTIKVLSMAFKPTGRPESEGTALWLGNSFGELSEVQITTQNPLVATNNSVHSRRPITKIYRHKDEMWTLDDSGALYVWGPDVKGAPNLASPPSVSYKLPKLPSFSMVVGDELWHATGKDIRVFLPTLDGRKQFQVLQRPLSQPSLGDVTSGALIDKQPDRVYLGHDDGKVSIYSRQKYACLKTINVSLYKINALAGAGHYLWAAYNTGMIYIYDTSQTPWAVKKDWRAHGNPVISIVVDGSSLWKVDRLQVVSLGGDNILRTWDGLLQDDWLEMEMQEHDTKFCNFEQIKTLVMTWNAGASTPHSLRYADQDARFFPNLVKESNMPDVLVFGFQELVDLEDKKTTAKSYFSKSKKKDPSEQEHMSRQYRDWRDYLIRCLDDSTPRDELYHLIHSSSLVGLFTCVFVRGRLRDRITDVRGAEVKRGMGGRIGNKGALVLRFMIDDTSVCFVNCHLAAGQSQTKDRNLDAAEILDSPLFPVEHNSSVRLDSYVGGGDGTMILDHEICILHGDLNYRIDTMSRDAVINAIKVGNIGKLLERDQLLASKRKRPGFRLRAFYEMPITFAPTYKYDVGSDTYDSSEKKRAPAWCDRILSRGRDRQRLEQLDYRRHEVRVSDHRPVTGLFRMTIKTISPQRRAVVWEETQHRFEEVKHKVAAEITLDFLSNICGFDSKKSQRILKLLGDTRA